MCGSLETEIYELELVDLVGKLEDEDLVEVKALIGTGGVVKEVDEGVGELMP